MSKEVPVFQVCLHMHFYEIRSAHLQTNPLRWSGVSLLDLNSSAAVFTPTHLIFCSNDLLLQQQKALNRMHTQPAASWNYIRKSLSVKLTMGAWTTVDQLDVDQDGIGLNSGLFCTASKQTDQSCVFERAGKTFLYPRHHRRVRQLTNRWDLKPFTWKLARLSRLFFPHFAGKRLRRAWKV